MLFVIWLSICTYMYHICSCTFYYFIMCMEFFTRYYIHVHVHIEKSLITHDNHKVGRHDRKWMFGICLCICDRVDILSTFSIPRKCYCQFLWSWIHIIQIQMVMFFSCILTTTFALFVCWRPKVSTQINITYKHIFSELINPLKYKTLKQNNEHKKI